MLKPMKTSNEKSIWCPHCGARLQIISPKPWKLVVITVAYIAPSLLIFSLLALNGAFLLLGIGAVGIVVIAVVGEVVQGIWVYSRGSLAPADPSAVGWRPRFTLRTALLLLMTISTSFAMVKAQEPWRVEHVLRGHAGLSARQTSFSPDGKLAMTVGETDKTVRIWETMTGRCLQVLESSAGHAQRAYFSPDGKGLAILRDDNAISIWNSEDGKARELQVALEFASAALQFSRDSRRLLVFDPGGIYVWQVSTGRKMLVSSPRNFKRGRWYGPPVQIRGPGGEWVLAFDSTKATVINVETGASTSITPKLSDGFKWARLSDDGTRVVTISQKSIQLWNARTGAKIVDLMKGEGAMIVDGQGQVIVRHDDWKFRLFNLKTGQPVPGVGAPELEELWRRWRLQYFAFPSNRNYTPDGRRRIRSYHRPKPVSPAIFYLHHPRGWRGNFYLPEFYVCVLLLVALLWSTIRDQRMGRSRRKRTRNERPETQVEK